LTGSELTALSDCWLRRSQQIAVVPTVWHWSKLKRPI